jgi:hypothetical protein
VKGCPQRKRLGVDLLIDTHSFGVALSGKIAQGLPRPIYHLLPARDSAPMTDEAHSRLYRYAFRTQGCTLLHAQLQRLSLFAGNSSVGMVCILSRQSIECYNSVLRYQKQDCHVIEH